MKRLLAVLLLCASTAFAATPEFKVNVDKDQIVVKEDKGATIVLPRVEVAKVKTGNDVIFVLISLVHDTPVALVVLERHCKTGNGNIGVMDTGLNQLIAMVSFDSKEKHKSPAFIAEYICSMGLGTGKATTKKPVGAI